MRPTCKRINAANRGTESVIIKNGTTATLSNGDPYVHGKGKSRGKRKPLIVIFWMTPSPNEIVGGKSSPKRSDKKRQRTCRHLSLELVASSRLVSAISTHFNFYMLSTQIFHQRVILSSDDRNGTTKRRRKTIPQHLGTAF
jgi:hypothetical protein